jgi:hypothetical protein
MVFNVNTKGDAIWFVKIVIFTVLDVPFVTRKTEKVCSKILTVSYSYFLHCVYAENAKFSSRGTEIGIGTQLYK